VLCTVPTCSKGSRRRRRMSVVDCCYSIVVVVVVVVVRDLVIVTLFHEKRTNANVTIGSHLLLEDYFTTLPIRMGPSLERLSPSRHYPLVFGRVRFINSAPPARQKDKPGTDRRIRRQVGR
jgi:hypothetical protein